MDGHETGFASEARGSWYLPEWTDNTILGERHDPEPDEDEDPKER